jgi:hypothetical protein
MTPDHIEQCPVVTDLSLCLGAVVLSGFSLGLIELYFSCSTVDELRMERRRIASTIRDC